MAEAEIRRRAAKWPDSHWAKVVEYLDRPAPTPQPVDSDPTPDPTPQQAQVQTSARFSVSVPVSSLEGNSGTTSKRLNINEVAGPSGTFLRLCLGGTATLGQDYNLYNANGRNINEFLGVLGGSKCLNARWGYAYRNFQLRIVGDTDIELDETIIVTVTPINDLSDTTGLPQHAVTATYTIHNDDDDDSSLIPQGVEFTSSEYRVNEDAGTVTIGLRVNRSNNPQRVQIQTVSVTTDASDLNILTAYWVTVPAGYRNASFDITIIDDTVPEGEENFIVRINQLDNKILNDKPETNVVIRSNDLSAIPANSAIFSRSSYKVPEEDGTVDVQVIVPSSTSTTLLTISTRNNTATAGVDYLALSNHAIAIPAGKTTATFSIFILDDDTKENSSSDDTGEDFNVVVNTINGIAPTKTIETEVVILDNEFDIEFSGSTFLFNEGQKKKTVTVRKGGSTRHSTTISFFSEYLGAEEADIGEEPQPVTFAPGEREKLVDDRYC